MINVGVIGCGQWGPNHIRIFSHLPNSRALMCADLNAQRLKAVRETFTSIETTADYRDILNNKDIRAVCIASPTNTHFVFAKEALEHDKHVLCEKPLALTADECGELAGLAAARKRTLMVGHVFLFNAGIMKLKEYIRSGELGCIHYAHSTRTNLGPFRYDVNALWDLAPHDISIFNYLFDGCPVNVSARGQKCLGTERDDLAFGTLEYPGNTVAHLHVSWIDPKKVRQITIVGEKKMVTWDDLDDAGPIKLYDKHVEKSGAYYLTYGEFRLLSKEGGTTIPKVELNEPLRNQDQYFIDCIERNVPPELADARKGRDVVRTLVALQQSIERRGACVEL
ncbi:MAG: Gfo/Idh/MocA family oxidoreductase [Candidatus Omnitrophica bacterium]|nr:Gfo/Idh/MocA family oxidoreductase [Candidatus Omnitrophota bacterium]